MDGLCMALQKKRLIAHNAVFDCAMIANNYGVDLMPSVHSDTMILAHLLDENRRVGLKELCANLYGDSAKAEQDEMKASVTANGGLLTKACYELYKADAHLIAKYGAKDAILTYNLFYELLPELYKEGLDKFFYEDESMPLLRGCTYQLNTVGLKIDLKGLQQLRKDLEVEIMETRGYIYKEIEPHVKQKYPGTGKTNHFNIGAPQQISWLLFDKLGNNFTRLGDTGRELCHALELPLPYTNLAKRNFIQACKDRKGWHWRDPGTVWDKKTRKYKGKAKVNDYWTYLSADATTLANYAEKYKWVKALLQHNKATKMLSTVEGIEEATKYGIIHPSFLQHGTTSGRYSSRYPNFQNLPRDDKRIKACIVSRPGKVFVGADYSQLEPRVFASLSKDERLLQCFKDGDDFYSVIGASVFGKSDATMKKDDSPNSFPVKYKKLREVAKVIALATPYGTCAPQMSSELKKKANLEKSMDECQEIIEDYFANYPSVHKMMLAAHEQAKTEGVVYNLFGRPRRIPKAKEIKTKYGKMQHKDLPREYRTLLNLGMNHTVQSTGASVVNRAAIRFLSLVEELGWKDINLILNVHDELVVECPEDVADAVVTLLKEAMENTVVLPGVDLIAEPKIGHNLAELK